MSSKCAIRKYCGVVLLAIGIQSAVLAQPLTWQDISGVPGATLLTRNTDGRIFLLRAGAAPAYDGKMASSVDDGVTWTDGPLPPGGLMRDFAATGNVLVINREFPALTVRFNHQVHISTNGGASWTAALSQEFFEPLRNFMVTSYGAVYGVEFQTFPSRSPRGLARYLGGLNNWELVGTKFLSADAFSQNSARCNVIDASNTMYVGTSHDGIFITSDFGVTWRRVLPDRSVSFIKLVNDSTIIAATTPWAEQSYVVPTNGGVFMSRDRGNSWVPYGLANTAITAVDIDAEGNLYASAGNGVWRRAKSANTWTSIGPNGDFFTGVMVVGSGTLLVTHPDLGVFRSTDAGESWVQNGVRSRDLFALATDDANNIFVGTLGGRVFRSPDGGHLWLQSAEGSICDYVYGFARRGSTLYAGTDCGVYRTTDRGVSWQNLSQGSFTGAAYDVVVSGTGTLLAATDFGVRRSTDDGASWISGGLSNYKVLSLAAAPGGEIYVCTENDGVLMSQDEGISWTARGLVRNDLQTVEVSDSGVVFVGVYGGLFRSSNRGITWDQRIFLGGYVYALAFRAQTIYAGSYNGVYLSPDHGTSWQAMTQTGMEHPFVLSLSFDQTGNLLAGSYRGAIYRTSQPLSGQALLTADDGVGLPKEFALQQNYPNPFNPLTHIKYSLPKAGFVSLDVFNVLGQRIATLVNGEHQAGRYSVGFDAASLPSGMYFYRLVTDDFSSVRKMILLK